KKDRQTEKHQTLLMERQKLAEEKENVRQTYAEQQKHYHEQTARLEQLKNDLGAARRDYQASQTKLYKGYQFIEKLQSKKEMLEDMKEDFQGFFQGVKAVLKAREKKVLTGIHGAVIELVDVPKTYAAVIETVLRSQAQHLIARDDQAARQAITWLKQTNSGRATFLPLTSIRPRFITNDILAKVKQHPGFVGIAADLV